MNRDCTPLPAKIYANEGIARVINFEADGNCEASRVYQVQREITLPKI